MMNPIESKCTIKLLEQCRMLGIEKPVLQYKFDEKERYSNDLAFLKKRIVVECEGFGHATPDRYESDLRKYNLLAIRGFRLLRFKPNQILSGESISVLRSAFFPPVNYLQRCMVCLLELGKSIHTECFETFEPSIDNEFLWTEKIAKKEEKHYACASLPNGAGLKTFGSALPVSNTAITATISE